MKSMHCKLPSGENFKAKVRDNSTIRTVREELSRQIKIPESYINLNISNRIRNLQNPTPIRSLGINPSDNIDVTFIPPRLSFQYGKTAPFSLPFQINSTIENAKKMLAPRYHVSPETIKLSLYNIELANDQLLRNIRIPINRHIQINIEKPKSKSALLFMMQHEAYRLEFPDETTVAQIKDELMRHADKATISIQLLYNGLYLDDNAVLKDLNINPKSCIIVESEMLEREDFILENNSFDDDNDMDSFLDNKTHAARARTAIMKRRREMRQLSKQCNSNLTSSTKVPIVQPDFSKTAPTTQRVQKRAQGGQNSLSKTLSGSLKSSQNESEIEEEEESESLVEQQSLDKLTEQQSNELLGGSQSFDQSVIPQNVSLDKIGSGQNIPNVTDSENAEYGKSSAQNSADLTDIVGSLTKIAQSGSNDIDENRPVMMARGMPESNEPATLEDSIPVGNDQDEARQPATLEDSIPVENGQDDAANQPMTLEEPVPPDDPEDTNQPATLEDSIPVNDNGEPYEQSADDGSNLSGLISGNASGLVKNDNNNVVDFNETDQNATQNEGCEQHEFVKDFHDASEQAKPAAATRSIKPATLEGSIPVGDDQENSNSQEGSGLSNVLSAVASGLTGNNEANGEDEAANQPATLEDLMPVENGQDEDANQPATLEDSMPVGGDQDEEAAGEPVTLDEQASSGLSNLLPGVANSLTSNTNDNDNGEDEQAVVSRDIAEDEKVDDEEAANQPATLEETVPEDQAGSGLSNLLSGVASGLTNSMENKNDNDNEAAEENQDEAGQPATLEDSTPVEEAQERNINEPATLEDSVPDEDVQDEVANEPATLEETAPEDQAVSGLSNLLSGVASELTNSMENKNDNDDGDEAGQPATLEDSTPVEEAQERNINEPATLEETAPEDQAGSGLSNLLSGVASGLTNSMENGNEQTEDVAADDNQTEERSKPLELAEAEEGGNGDDQGGQAAVPDLSKLINERADGLTEENESNNQSGGDLSSLITGNAQALTGNNDNNNNNADGNDS